MKPLASWRRPAGFLVPCCGLLVIGMALIGAWGCDSQPTAAEAHTADNFLAQKAKETGGDFSKLSPADQKKAQELTQGHGPEALRGLAAHPAAPPKQ